MNKSNLAIIGSSKIAQIHYKFLEKYNFSQIFFISRSKKKIFNFLKKKKIINTKNLLKSKIKL